LYVIDTLPLVYRFLPREQLPAARVGPAPDFGDQDAQQRPADDPAQSFLGQLLNMTQRNVRKLQPPTHMALVIDVPGATYRCALLDHCGLQGFSLQSCWPGCTRPGMD
jgi:hypothetical protein